MHKGRNSIPALVLLKHTFNRNDKSEHITHLDNVVRIIIVWSEWRDSNSRPPAPKAGALPTAQHPDMRNRETIILYGNILCKLFFIDVLRGMWYHHGREREKCENEKETQPAAAHGALRLRPGDGAGAAQGPLAG